jgi:uncharacterized membrane protein SpoIIM required for sporulation
VSDRLGRSGGPDRAKWLEERRGFWRETGERLASIERGSSARPEAVLAIVRAYPEIARDLALARRAASAGGITRFLETLHRDLHRSLFRSPERLGTTIRALLERDAPAAARALSKHIAAVTVLFFLCAAAGFALVHRYPELAGLFASERMIEQVSQGQLWTDNLLSVFPSSLLAVQIFSNNIMVSLFAVCLGVMYGLGTLYIVGMNGLMLGAIFAFTAQHGLAGRLFEFVCAHGFVELSVIFVAGAVGASLGEALARPGQLTRGAAFRNAVRRGMGLMAVCLAFLVGAGVIEGYVSPDRSIPLAARLAIGLGYFTLFVLVLSGALGRRRLARSGA